MKLLLRRTGAALLACLVLASLALLAGCGNAEQQSGGGADGTKTDTPQTTVQRNDKSLK